MARVNILKMVNAISNEDVEKANDQDVNLEGKKDLPTQLKGDEGEKTVPCEEVAAAVSGDTKTTEPGPSEGGGDGTAQVVDVKNVKSSDKVENHIKPVDQANRENGGDAPDKVSANDGNVSTTTSVEEHEDGTPLETIETGGDDCIEPADDMVQDIEEGVDQITASGLTSIVDEKGAIADKIHEEIGDMEEAAAAVENYRQILRGMKQKGREMSPELQESFRIGLESIDKEFFQNTVVSLEAGAVVPVDGFNTSRDATESKLGAKAKKIWEAIQRAFFRAMSALQDMWNAFIHNTDKIEEKLKDLKNRSRSLEGGKPLKLANATRLMIGDKYVGDSPNAIKEVTNTAAELLIKWPVDLQKLLDNYTNKRGLFGANAKTFEALVGAIDGVLERGFRDFKSLSPADKNKVPSGFRDSERLQWSGPLPGNRAVYVGIRRSKQPDPTASAVEEGATLNKLVNISFSAMPEESTHTGEQEVQTMSSGEAQAVIKALQNLLDVVTGHKDGMRELRKIIDNIKILQSADFWGGVVTGDTMQLYAGLMVTGAVNATTETQHQFIGYLIAMIKAYMAVIESSIKAENNVIEGEVA